MTVLRHSARAILISAFGAALIGVDAPAHAQADPISHCRENTDGKSERIACLEAAILGLMGGPSQALSQADGQAGADGQTDAAPPQTRLAETEAAPAAMSDAPTGLGAEQVVKREVERGERDNTIAEKRRSERVTSKIVDFARTDAGFLLIFLENGQIWRQRKSDSAVVRLRKSKDYEAEIRRGVISGYRMRIPAAHQTIVVERIK